MRTKVGKGCVVRELGAEGEITPLAFFVILKAAEYCIEKLQLPPHVFITIVPGETLKSGDGADECGWACYFHHWAHVGIAGIQPSTGPLAEDRSEWLYQLQVCTAHELIHYRQELDGMPEDERETDADRRAEPLIREMYNERRTKPDRA